MVHVHVCAFLLVPLDRVWALAHDFNSTYKRQLDAPARAPVGASGKARGRSALLCARTSNAA